MSLLGALIGSNSGLFAASQANQNIAMSQAQLHGSSVHYSDKPRMKNKTIFSGRIEVQQVCNGYIVHIASREGYEFDSHIAPTIKDVNDLISTAIVAFQLEGS
jgi:hypothetical protein